MRLFEVEIYTIRKSKLASHVRDGLILLLVNNEAPMNYTENTYPFRQDSIFLYFFGLKKPEFAATIDCETGECTLFGDDPTIDEIVWTGPQKKLRDLGAQVRVFSCTSFNEISRSVQISIS